MLSGGGETTTGKSKQSRSERKARKVSPCGRLQLSQCIVSQRICFFKARKTICSKLHLICCHVESSIVAKLLAAVENCEQIFVFYRQIQKLLNSVRPLPTWLSDCHWASLLFCSRLISRLQ